MIRKFIDGIPIFPALIGRPWGQKIKVIISLERDRIKLIRNNNYNSS